LSALDALDTSISLRRRGDHAPTEGARFEVRIKKGRGIHGVDARPFEACSRSSTAARCGA